MNGSNCIPFNKNEHAIHNVRRVMKTEQHGRRSALGQSSEGRELNIESAAASYEGWMRSCTAVVASDLRSKHEQMKESPFQFLRGTFYMWAQLWPSICAELCDAPKVLAVGDLHVNSLEPGGMLRGDSVEVSTISMSLTPWPTQTTSSVWPQV